LYDSEGLKILTEQECRDLLGTVPHGRIVFTDRALPAIQPVNFVMADGAVVISTAAGSKLAAAARNAVVAFEIDEFDDALSTGWSVVVIGHARVVAEDGELSHLRDLPLKAWTLCEPVHYIAITPELISGRSLPAPEPQITPSQPTPR
jgi:nitroimidazol reductase NimA-like FMN-containing flavoprotein (pyridoxamine 5'-phosphate oxidase superfamily)